MAAAVLRSLRDINYCAVAQCQQSVILILYERVIIAQVFPADYK